MIALVPPLLALPLFFVAKRKRASWQRASGALVFIWAALAAIWLLVGGLFFLYASSWAIWSALFIYIATLGDDDDEDDPWDYSPEGPFLPGRRKVGSGKN